MIALLWLWAGGFVGQFLLVTLVAWLTRKAGRQPGLALICVGVCVFGIGAHSTSNPWLRRRSFTCRPLLRSS
jgi:hypothetical protein